MGYCNGDGCSPWCPDVFQFVFDVTSCSTPFDSDGGSNPGNPSVKTIVIYWKYVRKHLSVAYSCLVAGNYQAFVIVRHPIVVQSFWIHCSYTGNMSALATRFRYNVCACNKNKHAQICHALKDQLVSVVLDVPLCGEYG